MSPPLPTNKPSRGTDQLSGIIPPLLTPMDRHGRFDEEGMHRLVDWLIDRGVDGVFADGSTGEFSRLSEAERLRVVEVTVAAADGRVPVVAGATECDVNATVAACQRYQDLGVAAAVVLPPIYLPTSNEGVASYFADIAERTSLGILLYNIPALATEIDVDTVVRLATTQPNIIGIKDTSGNLPNLIRMRNRIPDKRPDFRFFVGWDGLLATALSLGADGGMVASANVVPEVMVSIRDHCDRGDYPAAFSLQSRLLPLFDAMLAVDEFPEGFRIGVAARGLQVGESRVSYSDTTRKEHTKARGTIGNSVKELLSGLKATAER